MISGGALPRIVFSLAWLCLPSLAGANDPGPAGTVSGTNAWSLALEQKAAALFQSLPPPAKHEADLREADVNLLRARDAAYETLLREKLAGQWFAALIATSDDEPLAIRGRFETWRGLVEFLAAQNALVEVWACGEGGGREVRRVPATELADWKRQRSEPPTVVTTSYRNPASGKVVTYRVEFGFQAATVMLTASRAYQRHRLLQLSAQAVLGATNAQGQPDAIAQQEALRTEIREGRLLVREGFPGDWTAPNAREPERNAEHASAEPGQRPKTRPGKKPPPAIKRPDLFVAVEFEVDGQNNYVQAVYFYRDSEVRKRIVRDTQVIFLQPAGEPAAREVLGFRRRGLTDQLEPVANPILGQDTVELRVQEPREPDPAKWHVVEFGEPELIKQSALAHFSLLRAYLEKNRKTRAMKQANLALIAEPLIASMNIGGSLAGLGFPAGEPARLLYDLVTWKLISQVPSVKQMRELFALMAARDRRPDIKAKPEQFLSQVDIQILKEAGRKLSDQEVQAYLERMSDDDLRAMLRLARMGMIDARVTTFLNVLTSVFKISGVAEEDELIRDLFNNVRFAMNGDINLKTLLMLALGKSVMTPLSGVSLETLSHGEGPQEAWLQYLEISVDIRAVINTLVRLTKSTEAKKELEKPFAYSPRMSELAAYEIRIFGFPLLMFYKRGLIKADFEAYQHDYAYGLRGVTLVEHFRTREEMEAEVRAGRMFPLGLVRVPAVRGGWQDTDLVVYAHRIPSGKYRGKTALIIYGLKAYAEYSDLIARELIRFKELEKGLQEGAVIEQRMQDQPASSCPARAYEPVIHVGSNAVQQIYNPLLGNLLELRRHWRRQSWGWAVADAELQRLSQALAPWDVPATDGDALVEIDPYNSSFIYRRLADGHEQIVKVTHIPSLADIERDRQKAEEGKVIEDIRREAAAGRTAGVVLLNEMRETNGRLEIGPLRRNSQGKVVGAGLTSGAKAMADIFELISRLPVTDRARLRFNHFAATVVTLDRERDGAGEKVFLTIEFPLGEARQEWINPLCGEPETMVFRQGLWRQTLSDRQILDLEYDAANTEIRSRTFSNLGTRQVPIRGPLLEETQTLEVWFRDLSQPDFDPYSPVIAKLRVNYATGQFCRETYGLYALPVESADDQYITQNRYNPYGVIASARVFENGRGEADFRRPFSARVLNPIPGRERFRLHSRLPGLADLRDLSASGYRTVLEREDLIRRGVRTETYDAARSGRKIAEQWRDPFDGAQSFAFTTTLEYADDFFGGLMPVRTITASASSGARLTEVITIAYDPAGRRLTGRAVDYTGKTQTNTWDYRWMNPVEIETTQRRIVNEYNREETAARSTTIARDTGETIRMSTGQYNATGQVWRVVCRRWLQEGIPAGTETNLFSAAGRLISARWENLLEQRPRYDAEGREWSSQTFQRNAATGRYDTLNRQEDDYRWREGERDARIQVYLEGTLGDEYRTLTDREGRVIEDRIHHWPQVELKTVVTYEGATDRVRRTETRQNGEVRVTHQTLTASRQADGNWLLNVKVIPYWGLVSTNSYLLGDPLGRLVASEYENGDRARIAVWFAGTAEAKVTELIDRHGRVKERWEKRLGERAAAGLPYDVVTRYKVSPWGDPGWAEEKAVVRGTDVALFSDGPEERTYFDLAKCYDSPRYAADSNGHFGLQVQLGATVQSNVTAIFASRFRDLPPARETNQPPERVLAVGRVELRGLFFHRLSQRLFDRMGSVVEEAAGEIRNLGQRTYSDKSLRAELERAVFSRRIIYRYEPGWIREDMDATTRQPVMAFTARPASSPGKWPVNNAGWREWPTEVAAWQIAAGNSLEEKGGGSYPFRRHDSPRLLRHNPFLPGMTNVWLSWRTADLNLDGEALFGSETIFNARGEQSALVVHKVNSLGHPATKIVYQLPSPGPAIWRTVAAPQTAPYLQLNLARQEDLSRCAFVVFYLDAPSSAAIRARFRDQAGRQVTVASDGSASRQSTVAFWPIDSAPVQWWPNEHIPERGSAVTASAALIQAHQVFVVSIPELTQAGLDAGGVDSIDLEVTGPSTRPIRISSLYKLEHDGPPLTLAEPRGYRYDVQTHSSGLTVIRRRTSAVDPAVSPANRDWNSMVKYDGATVAALKPRYQPPHFPILLLTDEADPDRPRPLYALAADNGAFLEYYQTVRAGDTRVYTVVNGFDTPKLEVYRAGILDDEISPGLLAFGQGYYVTLPLAKDAGGLSGAMANLHNRCLASAFALGADHLLRFVFHDRGPPAELGRVMQEHGPAVSQVREINQMPTLAGALLPRRPVPWPAAEPKPTAPPTPGNRTNALKDYLHQLSALYLKTKLIPTALGTGVERYIDTVQEAGIIELAVKLNEPGLANELLSFYWDKSQAGLNPVHACYDARTGASLEKQTRYTRPSDAETTAAAQLAMAQAAFCLGTATSDRQALDFGTNLIHLVLGKFRPAPTEAEWPRGIADRIIQPVTKRHGLILWPAPPTYSLENNARALLLFLRLGELADRYPFAPEWKQMIREAAREQTAWLTNRIMPHVLATGVVPKGLFEIQDVHQATRALAVERWTATADWLAFIEAADRIGVDQALSRSWLDNLARVHGVTVKDTWGLDWGIALARPDAIAVELTAKFGRIASLVGHHAAADFANKNLDKLRQNDTWPAILTAAGTQAPLATGQGFAVYPAPNPNPIRGRGRPLAGWPETLGVYAELAGSNWPVNLPRVGNAFALSPRPTGDFTQFVWTAAVFYLAIVAVSLFWWTLSCLRHRRRARFVAGAPSGLLVPPAVMQQAEERWAKRVLGMQLAAGADRSRYSNGAVEENFYTQLRVIYKLVLEWRRAVNGWPEGDPRLVEDGGDEWLNGMDEFAVLVGVYTRWVVKAGRKDGARKEDVLRENEDSNHIWSRLVMYFAESHQRLLRLIKEYQANPAAAAVLGVNDQIELVLRMMGVRACHNPFDARAAFAAPGGASALDLLLIQQPGATLARIVAEMERQWGIPANHVINFIKGYKSFKEREQLFPIHPYVFEAAKMLPHFLLMGLVALIWYNNGLGGLNIYAYLRELVAAMALDWHSLIWGAPLFAGFALSAMARFMEIYRYRWGTRPSAGPRSALEAEIASHWAQDAEIATPALRVGRWWNPLGYRRAGWILRGVGLALLAVALWQLEPPSFALFMCVKGLLGTILLIEAAGLLGPIIVSRISAWLEDRVTDNPKAGRMTRLLSQLNLVPTRPASLVWLAVKYHFQPSVPTGGWGPMLQAIGFYLLIGAAFFFVGSYMYKQTLEVWFQEAYRNGSNLGLVLGAFLFWNTMYLLRFGLFVLIAAVSSALAIYPVRVVGGLAALFCSGLLFVDDAFHVYLASHPVFATATLLTGLALMIFEPQVVAGWRALRSIRRRAARQQEKQRKALAQFCLDRNRVLGVVYMSGDDLSFNKLTAELLMTRLGILRDQLQSDGIRLFSSLRLLADDAVLSQRFQSLYELEKRHDATLWHPLQLVVAGESPALPPDSGLNLIVDTTHQREELLATWHLRRWLVTMMSTAGHSQDTGINLVDMALSLTKEGLNANTAFYLIQNKYDNNDHNRPAQLSYDQGELGQRNKLARLLMAVAPGSRAYSVNDWTPFGFKAGGLVGMDLVYEESLKLTNMLILDRNANVHDLDALMADLKLALADPGIVIVIPGRSTTNTLTAIGQGSQLIEEGQRALTRGVMLLGGMGAETLGTGWGNIQAVFYGRVQHALCDVSTPKLPLTTPAQRSATFGDRCEGLIGFGPHAIGISEDIWGVTQAAHNALSLGYRVRFCRSQALWHKVRETWSHAEWFSAFPRWAGGYLQMMLDPLMQKINDMGPLCVFAKEIRASGGRFFLGAPSALLSILLMPLAIIWDVSPFVQILILLWNLGLVMNQVLTALGLVACLESTGFNRALAVAGAAGAGILAGTLSALTPFTAPLMVFGLLAGGFAMGLGRWLYFRGRDVMLFGPQLVIHTLGQVVRQSLEFVLSGAAANDAKAINIAFRAWVGPREDRPSEGYQNYVNLRTVVWGVGLLSLLLNLFALANLDFLNVLLLLPSLMFSVSILIGPFLMQPKPGRHLGGRVWIPKLLGWIASFGFYVLVAGLIARGGWSHWLGIGLFILCYGRVALAGLKYLGYARGLKKLTGTLARLITEGGMELPEAQKLADHFVRGLGGDVAKARAAMGATALAADRQEAVATILQNQVLPYLKRPSADAQRQALARRRFGVECRRSFALGLFTFIWFFIVPMPGLLVFTAPGGYRLSLSLASILGMAAGTVGVALAGRGVSLLLEWWEQNGMAGRSLTARIETRYHSFQALLRQPGRLSAEQTAGLYALFTDVHTYFDQRSYAYVQRALLLIEEHLRRLG